MLVRTLLALFVTFALTVSVVAAQEKDKKDKGEKAPTPPVGSKAKSRPAADSGKKAGSTKKKAAAPDEPASTLPPAEEFVALYREFKELVNRLGQIQQKYGSDPNADKEALEKEFNAKVEQTKVLETRLSAAAETAYLASPNNDREQNEYLMARLNKLIATDDYEEAVRLTKVLIANQFDMKFFNTIAGLALFGGNDFENAEKYLKLAEKQGELDAAQFPPAAVAKAKFKLIGDHNYKELWEKEQAIRATEEKAGDLPRVKLETNKGDIVVELFENEAPIATNNFVNLVEKKFYDGVKFHRVLPGFMAQGGDPKGDGSGGPGYAIPDEHQQSNHRSHFRGSLSMARTAQKDSGGSQFFLCFLPTNNLDGQYTVFGRVVDGFDVLAKLQRCQSGDTNTPDKITRATVLSKRNHKYEPKVKLPEKK